MRLRDLSPQFLKAPDADGVEAYVDSVVEADGLRLLCPVCFQRNGGPRGTHVIVCWRPRVPQTVTPTPGRWELVGTGYDDLSLVAGSSSVWLQTAPCGAHFFVERGAIRMC